jgi:prevent-host-death family protein
MLFRLHEKVSYLDHFRGIGHHDHNDTLEGRLKMNEQTISVAEAKRHFSELLGKVAYGNEQILIKKRGQPMVRLVPANYIEKHLGDVKGWLDEKDPFFEAIDQIVENRKSHSSRNLKGKWK